MQCPKCGGGFLRSRNRKSVTHPSYGSISVRRITCDTCDHKFSTVEMLQKVADVLVVDHFASLDKLKQSLISGIAEITRIQSRRTIGAALEEDTADGRS